MNKPKDNSIFFYQQFNNDSDKVSEFKIIQFKYEYDDSFIFVDVKNPKNTVDIQKSVYLKMISKQGHKVKTSQFSHYKTFLSLYNTKL